ncbi:MAG: hypothetical protein GY953_31240, partial [bacterium]|nr:hypothetical protein [bacterium]
MNGGGFSYQTRLEPPIPKITSIAGGTLTENQVIKRHICDLSQKTYFGYDLTIERLEDGRFRYTFSPLSITPEKMDEISAKMDEVFGSVRGWRPLALPQRPATQVLAAGETLALDLFVNPATGQKVVEYIQVDDVPPRIVRVPDSARDFSPDDVTLQIRSGRLFINGELAHKIASVRGSPIWIYIRGRGRFVFSLVPRYELSFQKAGEIRGSTMTWRYGGD